MLRAMAPRMPVPAAVRPSAADKIMHMALQIGDADDHGVRRRSKGKTEFKGFALSMNVAKPPSRQDDGRCRRAASRDAGRARSSASASAWSPTSSASRGWCWGRRNNLIHHRCPWAGVHPVQCAANRRIAMESRLTDLEIKVAFQEDLIETLNPPLPASSSRSTCCRPSSRAVPASARRAPTGAESDPQHEIPPHY
jgi:SlyX protein